MKIKKATGVESVGNDRDGIFYDLCRCCFTNAIWIGADRILTYFTEQILLEGWLDE